MVTRRDLEGTPFSYLRPPRARKADLKLYELPSGRVVVKDAADKGRWVRSFVAWAIRRESRMLLEAQGVPGVPRHLGLIDSFGLAVEYVEGRPLKGASKRGGVPEAFVDRFENLIAGLHARGIVHLDARQKANVLLDSEGRPWLVDFATAVYVGQSRLARVLVRLLGLPDASAVAKYRLRYRVRRWPLSRKMLFYASSLLYYLLTGRFRHLPDGR